MSTINFQRVFLRIALVINLIGASILATATTGVVQTALAKPLAAPTRTPIPKATTATTPTIQSATIVSYTSAVQTGQLVIGLSIDFPYGKTLLGSELNAFLSEGVLQVTLPNGAMKSFSGIPPLTPTWLMCRSKNLTEIQQMASRLRCIWAKRWAKPRAESIRSSGAHAMW